jgi:hypothetical protein
MSHCYPGAVLLCVTEFPALRPTIHCTVVKGRGKPRAATLIRIVGDLCLFGSRLMQCAKFQVPTRLTLASDRQPQNV